MRRFSTQARVVNRCISFVPVTVLSGEPSISPGGALEIDTILHTSKDTEFVHLKPELDVIVVMKSLDTILPVSSNS